MSRDPRKNRLMVACDHSACLRRFICLVALLAFGLGTSRTHAFCDSFHPVPEFYVGDAIPASPTYDATCTHNDIQSAVSAANCAYGTKIYITHEHIYTNQHIAIDGKNVTLIGIPDNEGCGPPSIVICDPVIGCGAPTNPLLSIGGQNGSGVFSITGTSNVTLQYLDINNGNNSGANGGGIGFDGTGSLTLDTTWVRASQAVVGGGVYFAGGSGSNQLKLLANTQILANTASDSGGGLAIIGHARLIATDPQILIEANHADAGFGGGIFIQGPAGADIGSPGFDGEALISHNRAAYGGGIAVTVPSETGSDAEARLFTTDPTQPVGIANNTATQHGGGIFLNAFVPASGDVSSIASVCAWDFRIEGNNAPDGAAIYADTDSSVLNGQAAGAVYFGICPTLSQPELLGAIRCTEASRCNVITGNSTDDPTSGSIIAIQDNGGFYGDRFAIGDNHARHMLYSLGGTTMSNCLIAGNQSDQELIYNANSVGLGIHGCTFANDQIGADHVIRNDQYVTIGETIIAEPGTLAMDYSGDPANLTLRYIISNDTTTLPTPALGVVQGTPQFVDLAGGDYHLEVTSLGVDLAPSLDGEDLDGNPRTVDLPSVFDAYGPRDAGAYERQNLFRECGAADSLYCDGFDH